MEAHMDGQTCPQDKLTPAYVPDIQHPLGAVPAFAAVITPRLAIEAVTPSVEHGRFAAKCIAGTGFEVEADIFGDGHDQIAAAVLWRPADETAWQEAAMQPIGNDRWRAIIPLHEVGRHHYRVTAWRDGFETYRVELKKKHDAGLKVSLEIEEGQILLICAQKAAHTAGREGLADALQAVVDALQDPEVGEEQEIGLLLANSTAELMKAADVRQFAVCSEPVLSVDVERKAAAFANWYELFPRSQSGDEHRHGTFNDVISRLPMIRSMGFDTLYMTPIHPIGHTHRKGRHNSLSAGDTDPGSPYAIGSEEGGHDAIHPALGTLDDFRRLRTTAAEYGLELALDFAIQCSPDHPWLREHPEWFDWRPDGSIRYAENPPKKYEDIVNVDFYAEGAMPGLWQALRDVVLFWVREGVHVFRVDNPHTKPLPFWEWLIADIRSRDPNVIFLSEAFTRPKPMYRLAKVGFSQSYTYFTWRHSKREFIDYMTELAQGAPRDFFRPHFFVNTPDINPFYLQNHGRTGFLIRAALASTLSGLWGVYSGFELCEGQGVPNKEEYYDSEKYRIKAWDWNRPGNIVNEITLLNRIRRDNRALHSHLGVRFLNCSDEGILYFVKATLHEGRFSDNVVLVAINLDPHYPHEADIEVPLWEFGMDDGGAVEVEDLVRGHAFVWYGKVQRIRIDPYEMPFSIWRIRPISGGQP
jgi:starch synthase (maltosyl-transferring)